MSLAMLSATGKTSSSSHRRRRHRHKGTTTAAGAAAAAGAGAGSTPRVKITETEMDTETEMTGDDEANSRSSRRGVDRKETTRGKSVPKRYAGQGRRPKSASAVPAKLKSKPKSSITERPASSASRQANAPKPGEPVKKNKSEAPAKNEKRSSGFMDALFGSRNAEKEKRQKQITCITCLADDIPLSKSAKLACSHRMCYACLKRIFTMSVSDPQHMPPQCCTSDHIPLKHVDRLFDSKFKTRWNKKYQEYMTQNRLYCPARGCGEWIRPNNIHQDLGGGPANRRRYGKCPRCKTKICVKCNRKWHRARDCPRDEGTQRFVEIAEQEGWQRCFNCSAMVELKEGCNHMKCRCTAEFCMLCGKKWKTCDCPWFNYENMDGDVLNQMNIPEARRTELHRQMEAERTQEQERRDEELARNLQRGLSLDDHDHDHDRNGGISSAPRSSLFNQHSLRQRTRPGSPIQDATDVQDESALSPLSDDQPPRRRRRRRNGA